MLSNLSNTSETMFAIEVQNQLKFYVYRLIDPRNGQTFYVGKGKGNRVFTHANAELENDTDGLSDKLRRIREIKNAGFDVAHIIHRHGLDEATAFEVEAALIDAYPEVTNIAGGHYSNERGIMHAQQVIIQYQAREIEFKHKVLMININRTAVSSTLYDAVRYAWKLDVKKARNCELVLAMQQGIVIGVFKPLEWLEATESNFPGMGDVLGRWGFVGVEAEDEIKKQYLRTRLPDVYRKQGAANPIRYSL